MKIGVLHELHVEQCGTADGPPVAFLYETIDKLADRFSSREFKK